MRTTTTTKMTTTMMTMTNPWKWSLAPQRKRWHQAPPRNREKDPNLKLAVGAVIAVATVMELRTPCRRVRLPAVERSSASLKLGRLGRLRDL